MSTHVPESSASRRPVKTLLDAEGLSRTLSRIAHEIIERNDDLESLALVGIRTRGVPLAERLAELIEERSGVEVALGAVDIAFHRDDRERRARPSRSSTRPSSTWSCAGTTCVLVDDVLYTGRTIRAAIETLFAQGRPARVQLAVLVDRGHRELPIRPDYVGKNLPTARSERIQVQLHETDGIDQILLVDAPEEGVHVKHLLSIGDLTRDDVERLLEAAHGLDGPRATAAPARQARPERLLRIVDADVVELRARGEAPLRRHVDDQGAPARPPTRASR